MPGRPEPSLAGSRAQPVEPHRGRRGAHRALHLRRRGVPPARGREPDRRSGALRHPPRPLEARCADADRRRPRLPRPWRAGFTFRAASPPRPASRPRPRACSSTTPEPTAGSSCLPPAYRARRTRYRRSTDGSTRPGERTRRATSSSHARDLRRPEPDLERRRGDADGRNHVVPAVVDDRMYVLGGRPPLNLDVVERYNPATNGWETVAPMPVAGCGWAPGIGRRRSRRRDDRTGRRLRRRCRHIGRPARRCARPPRPRRCVPGPPRIRSRGRPRARLRLLACRRVPRRALNAPPQRSRQALRRPAIGRTMRSWPKQSESALPRRELPRNRARGGRAATQDPLPVSTRDGGGASGVRSPAPPTRAASCAPTPTTSGSMDGSGARIRRTAGTADPGARVTRVRQIQTRGARPAFRRRWSHAAPPAGRSARSLSAILGILLVLGSH